MSSAIQILLVEDNESDILLIEEELRGSASVPFTLTHASRLTEALESIQSVNYDVVLLDMNLPDSTGLDTLARIVERSPETAVVLLTGNEDAALGFEAVKQGAQDYLIKGQAPGPLLFRVIRYSIERQRLENERQRLVKELKEALSKVKVLSGLVPICANCKNIRDDEGFWNHIEVYLQSHSSIEFTHGICPTCVRKLYPELGKPPE